MGSNSLLIIPIRKIFNFKWGELTKLMFDPITFGSDTILNYKLSQKHKLIKRDKFNYLTITLVVII